MKKMYLGFIAILMIAAVAVWNVELANANDQTTDLSGSSFTTVGTDALQEYTVGAPLTNWKTYRIQCTVTLGFSYGLVYTQSYVVWKDVCGYGGGLCLKSAGCL